MGWPQWLGDIPTWLTTLAVVIAAASYLSEHKRRKAEEDRESKAQATQLSAWTVTDVETDPRVYGVVIDNISGSTFHDIQIDVVIHDKATRVPIRLSTLPPGRYFVKYDADNAPYYWDFAIDAASYREGYLRPYTKTEKYKIEALYFSDNLNQRWVADSHAVLSRLDH